MIRKIVDKAVAELTGQKTSKKIAEKTVEKTTEKGSEKLSEKTNPEVTSYFTELVDQQTMTSTQGKAITKVALEPLERDIADIMDKFHEALMKRDPAMVKLKYEAMKESPFAFFRATDFLYYSDLKAIPELAKGVKVPLQGDFHLENMGTYRTSKGKQAFDMNDFDEAVIGPHTWDLARLATSIHLAAKAAGLKGAEREGLVEVFLKRYEKHLESIQKNPEILDKPLDEKMLHGKVAKKVEQATENFSRTKWLEEMTQNGQFRYGEKILKLSTEEKKIVEQAVKKYASTRPEGSEFFQVKDTAYRIAGKGSLGLKRYIALVEGPTKSKADDIIIEIKEARLPSAAMAGVEPSANEAQRIVDAQSKMLPEGDPYLGITKIGELDAYVKELLPKETVNLEKVNKVEEYEELLDDVALIMARAHARGGKIPSLISKTEELAGKIKEFAQNYYQQVKEDFEAFVAAKP